MQNIIKVFYNFSSPKKLGKLKNSTLAQEKIEEVVL